MLFTKNVQNAPPLALGRNERSWGWARCPRRDVVESFLGIQVLKAPPLAAGYFTFYVRGELFEDLEWRRAGLPKGHHFYLDWG